MAVHLVSLRWLAENRRPRAEDRAAQSAPPREDTAPDVDSQPLSTKQETAKPEPERGKSSTECDPADGRRSDGVLGLSSSEFDRLLNRFGLQGGRALLALIYKLSSIESELTALRKAIEKIGPSMPSEEPADHGNAATKPAPAPPAPPPALDKDQPGILDQVFRNNLTLWRKMD